MDEWRRELHEANEGKVGEPYHYPEGFMKLLGFIRLVFHLPYRQSEGFIRALAKYVEGLQVPDYSTINRRVNRQQVSLSDSFLVNSEGTGSPVTIAVDASGVKVHNGGDWIRRKWRVRKGYLKVHFAVDTETKQVVAMDMSSEKVHDGRRLKRLVNRAKRKLRVGRVIGDGAYDSRDNFRFLAKNGIEPAIRVRRNSSAKAGGRMPRKLAAAEQLRDYEAWRIKQRYGMRWRVEGVFSCIKRTFGEYVSAKKFTNMAREMAMKASLYNLFTGMLATQ